MEKTGTILEFLESMKPTFDSKSLFNNSWEIWNRINKGDSFYAIGFDSEEQQEQWKEANPYTNLL